ncbi:hypothetical protein I5731_12990 [Methylobrevis sp. L22]|uniref:Uncharacterized protein n=2 Tax=Methylobrevis albus TaxID=2793297 RepID=A0A931I3T4_9HYPH|nr:hypothetical protein [Methylobrevis albus]
MMLSVMLHMTEAAAAPPWNDDISAAYNIRANLKYFSGTIDQATIEAGEPGFENGEAANRSVWFKHRARADGYLVLISFTNGDFSRTGPGVGIDVFNGRSFRPSDRIVSAFPEDFLSSIKVSRVMVPVVAEQLIYIRVAAVGPASTVGFAFHIIHTDDEGDIILLPIRSHAIGTQPLLLHGETDCCVFGNFWPVFALVNMTTRPAVISYAKYDLPTSAVYRGGDQIPPRGESRPGLQSLTLGWNSDNVRRGQSGTWNYKFVAHVTMGALSKRLAVAIPLIRSRTDQARVTTRADNTFILATLGNTARGEIHVTNTSQHMAKGCRFIRARVGPAAYFAPTEFRWRRKTPPSPINAAVDIPAGATRTFEILLNTNFTGYAFGAKFDFACENAPNLWMNAPAFSITSLP